MAVRDEGCFFKNNKYQVIFLQKKNSRQNNFITVVKDSTTNNS